MEFIDRQEDIKRIEAALSREKRQFIVLYGRRRIGKSTLLRKVLNQHHDYIYYMCDMTSETNQRFQFATFAAQVLPNFDQATYPSWEMLFTLLSQQLQKRTVICIDEFPYLVKNCPELPSVIQRLIDSKSLQFDLIICGSSQQLMQGFVLDAQEPLYGRADEIIKLNPIPSIFIRQALQCDARQAVEEYAVWGGIPRYWELRNDYPDLKTAIEQLFLRPQGIMLQEPERLLRDNMRETVQANTILTTIGYGANKISEIAARAGKNANYITEPLARLREMGYVRRETPFSEDEKKSKRGIYRINDPLLSFHFKFVAPFRSYIEMGKGNIVMDIINRRFSEHVGACWGNLCRDFVSGSTIEGITYKMASRWWGKIFPDKITQPEGTMVELDVIAESFDGKHLLIGECKWTTKEDAAKLQQKLERIAQLLPVKKEKQKVHILLFLKEEPFNRTAGNILLPEDILRLQ